MAGTVLGLTEADGRGLAMRYRLWFLLSREVQEMLTSPSAAVFRYPLAREWA